VYISYHYVLLFTWLQLCVLWCDIARPPSWHLPGRRRRFNICIATSNCIFKFHSSMQTGAPCLLFNKRIRDVMLTTIFSSCCKQWILNNMHVLLFCQDYVNVTYNHRQVHNIRIINSMLKMPIKHNNQCWQTLIYLWRVQPSQNRKCNQLCIKCNFRYEILNKQTCLTLHPTIYNIIYIFNGQPKGPLLLCTPAFVVVVCRRL